jgi:hypothetical protein
VSRDGNGASPPENGPNREKLRDGIRRAILDALALELDRTSARTVGRLAAAGALGVAGSVGSVALFSGDLLRNGHGWYLAVCAAAWAGLLVACFSVVLLRIRIQRVPLTQASFLALVGLGLAAMLALLCLDRHHLAWWSSTKLGELALDHGGPGATAFCLGACSALVIGSGATVILALRRVSFRDPTLPGLFLFLVLWPAVVLQSAAGPAFVFAWWSAGLFAGSHAGVMLGVWSAARLHRRTA